LFLISVSVLKSDLGKTDYIGPHRLIPNETVSNQPGPVPPSTLQLRLDSICLLPAVPRNPQNIWLAAYLAVLNVALSLACRLVDAGFVPFSATRTSKTGFERHERFLDFALPSLSEAGRIRFAVERNHHELSRKGPETGVDRKEINSRFV
jgi:hypothetical protein